MSDIGSVDPDERHQLAARAALTWIDRDDRPHLIIDRQMKIRWANPAAVQMLRDGAGIDQRGGCLVLADGDQQARFLHRLANDDSEILTGALPLDGEGGHLLLRARRLECGDEVLFGLVMARSELDPCSFRDLDTAFGLTPAENRVLMSLLGGKDAEQITREMKVSIVTIRTHIRSIYAKLDVNSRERLFARVLPFRV